MVDAITVPKVNANTNYNFSESQLLQKLTKNTQNLADFPPNLTSMCIAGLRAA